MWHTTMRQSSSSVDCALLVESCETFIVPAALSLRCIKFYAWRALLAVLPHLRLPWSRSHVRMFKAVCAGDAKSGGAGDAKSATVQLGDPFLADLRLVLADKSTLWAHRYALMEISHFATLFREHHLKHATAYTGSTPAAPPLQTIVLSDSEPAIVRNLLTVVYNKSAVADITLSNVFDLFMIAKKLQVARLAAQCGEFFRQRSVCALSGFSFTAGALHVCIPGSPRRTPCNCSEMGLPRLLWNPS